jgi:hypothetical protein
LYQTSNLNCLWQQRSSELDNRKLARHEVSGVAAKENRHERTLETLEEWIAD